MECHVRMVKFHQLGSSLADSKDTFDELYRGGNHYDSSCAWKVLHWATSCGQRKQRCIRCPGGPMDDGWFYLEKPTTPKVTCVVYMNIYIYIHSMYCRFGKNRKTNHEVRKKITTSKATRMIFFATICFFLIFCFFV